MDIDLYRFEKAQESCFPQVLEEIRSGKKKTHWMWFIFPQMAGLGSSPTAEYYAIKSMEEAKAYLLHQLLSQRLVSLTDILVHDVHDNSAKRIFGYPDCLKFHSSMTLFSFVAQTLARDDNGVDPYRCFDQALEKFFEGKQDPRTRAMLRQTDSRKPI